MLSSHMVEGIKILIWRPVALNMINDPVGLPNVSLSREEVKMQTYRKPVSEHTRCHYVH